MGTAVAAPTDVESTEDNARTFLVHLMVYVSMHFLANGLLGCEEGEREGREGGGGWGREIERRREKAGGRERDILPNGVVGLRVKK